MSKYAIILCRIEKGENMNETIDSFDMNHNIEIIISGKKYRVPKGMTLDEISKNFYDKFKYPILIAKVDNNLRELNYTIQKNANIEFLDLTSREGNRVYVSGLVYLLIFTVKSLYGPNANIYVKHSLDKGIYIETNFDLNNEKLNQIKQAMKKVSENDLDIVKLTIDRLEAIKYFESIKDFAKADVLKYNTNTYVTLYRLGNLYNYFYTMMPSATSKIKDFDLTFVNERGLVLRFPTVYINDQIKKYEEHPNMFKVFHECREWGKIMHIENAGDLNKIVSSGKINDLIRMDETLQSNKLLSIAREINERKDKVKIILMAGPSSSGKTTTSRKLSMYLRSFGLKIRPISMDDYFLEKDETPLGPDGKPDFESLAAMDLKLFDEQIAKLLNKEEVVIPTYNFLAGKKEFTEKVKLADNEILVIEGIHGLDTNILTNIPRERKYKIYLSALTELNMDNHNRISTTDNRLLRRMIRDNRTRGYDVTHTLEAWGKVREGEEKYIFPYQDDSDATFNTGLIYEIGTLKTYVEPLLYSVDDDSPYYEEAKRLIDFLRLFLPIPSDAIPADSIIREFIGGSCYHD